MRTTPRSLLSLVALSIAASRIAAGEQCSDVSGNFRCNLAIPTEVCHVLAPDGTVYSIKRLDSAEPALKEALKAAFDGGVGPLIGSFTVCITGRNPTDTYAGRPVYIATLAAFRLASPP